jgi:ribosomal protein S18 acetylase RimI-like enzyme
VLRRSSLRWMTLLLWLFLAKRANGFSVLGTKRRTAIGLFSCSDINASSRTRTPFIIEKVGTRTKESIFQEISEMCIDVFFNDDEGPYITPWKQLQLSYLRNLQRSDLLNRKCSRKFVNDMFVARRVLPATNKVDLKAPLILDTSTICNVDEDVEDYVKGEVIGFCEVTERHFGLGPPYDDNAREAIKDGVSLMRPVLTNLAVHPSFRKGGVGSRLLETCEQTVANDWTKCEIILEVEEDNPGALEFYLRRGYSVVFEDPTSRRFSTNGLFVNKEKCTKICMRKGLRVEEKSSSSLGSTLLQTLRERVFSKL